VPRTRAPEAATNDIIGLKSGLFTALTI